MLLTGRWVSGLRGRRVPGVPQPKRGLRLLAKIALDDLFLASEMITAPFVPYRELGRIATEISDALQLFEARGWLAEPSRYHRNPPPLRAGALERVRGPWLDYQHLSYESGYAPDPEEPGAERWLRYEANRTAHARLLEHPGETRPWLVCVPGYRMGQTTVDFAGLHSRWLHRSLGLNVAIPILPFHGPRAHGRRGGDGFLTGDFMDTIHAQAQAVWDTRRLIRWLRLRGAPRIGVYGVSLGGYTTALIASLESDLRCAIAGIPAADFVRLITAHVPGFLLAGARRLGFALDEIERLLRVISPLALTPRVPHRHRYLYAGLADGLASPDHARDLWLHWGRPRMAWYPGGHVSFLWERTVRNLLEEALDSSGLMPAHAKAA